MLVAFLVLGMLLGSDGPGGIDFDDAELAREVGIVGLALILFEGGLQTSWRRLRARRGAGGDAEHASAWSSTALLVGVAAHALFDLSWLESILLGAVVASTDAAAVFATLRFTHVRRRLARTLEAESGGNDPMAIALTLGLIAWIESPDTYGIEDLALLVVRQLGLGLLVGVALGWAATWVFARLPALTRAVRAGRDARSGRALVRRRGRDRGSGFLAVYLVGLAIGSTPSRYRRQLVGFHEGLAFIAQVGLFIVLGLLVFPHELTAVALSGLALALLLVFVVRPVAVWVVHGDVRLHDAGACPARMGGLRGAVPIVLATFVLSSDEVTDADTIFNAVFFVVVVSVILQGTTLERVARWLDVVVPTPQAHQAPLEVDAASELDLVDFVVAPDHAIVGSAVRELGLPRTAIMAVVVRGDDSIPPRGSTVIDAGDRLYVLAPHADQPEVEDVFARWRRRV